MSGVTHSRPRRGRYLIRAGGKWSFAALGVALVFAAVSTQAASPKKYRMRAELATVDESGGEKLDARFIVSQTGRVLFRVDQPDGNHRWFASGFSGGSPVPLLPAPGFGRVEVRSANAFATAVGKSVDGEGAAYRETATTWGPGGEASASPPLDPGSSSFEAINASGSAVGAGYFQSVPGPRVFRQTPAMPGGAVELIQPPPGIDYVQPAGISGFGEALVYAVAGESGQAGVWSGAAVELLGPKSSANRTIFPSNIAINARGDVAVLAFDPVGRRYEFTFVPAGSRGAPAVFGSALDVESVFSLQMNDAGQAVFATSAQTVEFVDAPRGIQRSFAGYRPFLNGAGEVVFGFEGRVFYWDSRRPGLAPLEVPVDLPRRAQAASPGGLDDAGNLVATFRHATAPRETLAVFAAQRLGRRDSVELRAARNRIRATEGRPFRARTVRVRRNRHAPEVRGSIRFRQKGRLPRGLKFNARNARVSGAAVESGTSRIRVFAVYRAAGKRTRSRPASVAFDIR